MQMRERDGLMATVSVESTGDASCRLRMAVAEDGRPVWTSVRDVLLLDADCTTIERTALEATAAIADHLRRRQRRNTRPR
ncbi:MAG: hypothetical protein ABI920_13350 [Casimicrobiaceae bacterium]